MKRGWCIWVKELMDKCIDLMAKDKPRELRPLVERYLQDLRERKVPWQKLAVSTKYKGPIGAQDGYKNPNNNVYQMCTFITQTTGHVFAPGERLKFLIRQGPEAFYLRGVCINFVQDPSTINVDLLYYMKKQFNKNITNLLLYHQQYVDVQALYTQFYRAIEHDMTKQFNL